MQKVCDCPHCGRTVDITQHNMIDRIMECCCAEPFEPGEAVNVRDYKEFYRYEEVPISYGYEIYMETMTLVNETDKGYWIKSRMTPKKWVSKTSVKRYAYPTKYEAMINLIKRKERQIKILKASLKRANSIYDQASKHIKDMDKYK